MRWRLIVLATLGLILATTVAVGVVTAAELQVQADAVYSSSASSTGALPAKDQALSDLLYRQSSAIRQLIMPFTIGSLACGAAILVVLGRRWQLRTPPASERN